MLSVVKDPINSAGCKERFLGISFWSVIESDTKHWWELDCVEILAFSYSFLQINQLRWDEGISNALPLKFIIISTPYWLKAILERCLHTSLQLILVMPDVYNTDTQCTALTHTTTSVGESCSPVKS